MGKSLFFFLILTGLRGFSQAPEFLFVSVRAEKKSGVDYWCLDRNIIEKAPVSSMDEYYKKRDEFFKKKYEWPSAYLFTQKQAAVIAEVTIKDWAFNCSYQSAWVTYGKTPEEAEETLRRDVARRSSAKDTKINIVYTWKPLIPQDFKQVINGVEISLKKTMTNSGKYFVQASFKNLNTSKKAIVALVTTKGSLLAQPYTVPIGGVVNTNITIDGDFDFFVETTRTADEPTEPVMDLIKNEIKKQLPTGGPSRAKHFSLTCMCVRG